MKSQRTKKTMLRMTECDGNVELILAALPGPAIHFLATVPIEKMDCSGRNSEHGHNIRLLRKKGLFVLVGDDYHLTVPPELSPLGDAVKRLVVTSTYANPYPRLTC